MVEIAVPKFSWEAVRQKFLGNNGSAFFGGNNGSALFIQKRHQSENSVVIATQFFNPSLLPVLI
jgi:hypothetical protein